MAIAIPNELERDFRAHHGLVFATAYRITGNAGDAEDVLQTVFLRLLRRDRNADPLEKPESYLRRAAINAVSKSGAAAINLQFASASSSKIVSARRSQIVSSSNPFLSTVNTQ